MTAFIFLSIGIILLFLSHRRSSSHGLPTAPLPMLLFLFLSLCADASRAEIVLIGDGSAERSHESVVRRLVTPLAADGQVAFIATGAVGAQLTRLAAADALYISSGGSNRRY